MQLGKAFLHELISNWGDDQKASEILNSALEKNPFNKGLKNLDSTKLDIPQFDIKPREVIKYFKNPNEQIQEDEVLIEDDSIIHDLNEEEVDINQVEDNEIENFVESNEIVEEEVEAKEEFEIDAELENFDFGDTPAVVEEEKVNPEEEELLEEIENNLDKIDKLDMDSNFEVIELDSDDTELISGLNKLGIEEFELNQSDEILDLAEKLEDVKILPSEDKFPNPELNNDSEVLTPTIADIYQDQGLHSKAIEVYEILIESDDYSEDEKNEFKEKSKKSIIRKNLNLKLFHLRIFHIPLHS